jgi:phytoene dehydrogenase-like protein
MGVASLLGRVGLPAPIAELAARDWDAVVVGGGHNGLTAAAYLARAGQSVLVEGLYLCGAATDPAGSVIALNGRNAAMAVLEDAGVAAPSLTGRAR